MKKLLTSYINAGAAQPIKQGTLDHLQEAHQETTEWTNKGNFFRKGTYSGVTFYRVWGVYTIETAGTWAIGRGAIFHNGVMYDCEAGLITPALGQVVIGTITTTFVTATNADPVQFSDASTNNVHEVKKIVWSAGASGTGSLNLTDIQSYNEFVPLAYSASYLTASSGVGDWTVASSANFNVRINELGHRLIIDFRIINSSLAAITSNVRISINYPSGMPFRAEYTSICEYANSNNPTTKGLARVTAAAGSSLLYIQPIGDPNFQIITGGFDVRGQIIAEWGDDAS